MRLFHGRREEETALLASGALTGADRARAEAHRDGCARCTRDFAALAALVDAVAQDPARQAAMPIPLGALRTRVEARLDEEAGTPGRVLPRWAWAGGLAAAASVALVAGVLLRQDPREIPSHTATASVSPGDALPVPEPAMVSDETMSRLEETLARERTARYLNEAEDVILNVSASPQRCRRGQERVDVGDEARRSRELLARRSLLVELDSEALPQAQPLLDDVEQVLRDVAALEECARKGELEAIHRDVSKRRLLMKIDLMTRELQG